MKTKEQLDAEAAEIDKALTEAVESKNYTGLADLERRVTTLADARADLERQEARAKAATDPRYAALRDFGGDGAAQPNITSGNDLPTGAQANPLRFDQKALQTMHKSLTTTGQGVSVKAFSTVDSLIPAQLDPNILPKIHEHRLMDYLPTQTISAPSYEVIIHSSTTGSPAPTAEGAVKPELVLNSTPLTLTAVKLACHVGISYETLQDFGNFQAYATVEAMRELMDVENAQLLSGSETSGNMLGILNTSGILTHDASTDTGTNVTALDSIEISMTQLRTGSALAEADVLVLHPNTFSAIRRLKNTLGNFLIGDLTEQASRQLFGQLRMIVTTAIAAGTGLMLDTTKFGRVLLREGIRVFAGQTADDFTRNISRLVFEERLVPAVTRPSAVLAISNLPTTP